MMEYQKVKRYYSLFKLFIRLLMAFFNPFHELWMDDKVFKVWDLGAFYLRLLLTETRKCNLRVVQTKAILFLKSISEINGFALLNKC